LTLSDALAGMTSYTENNDTDSTTDRWANFNPNGVKGNVIVIAASVSDTTPDDQFKISKLDVCAEATKFFVVDSTNDNTYEYGPTGQALTNYKINAGNTNPRGVATTAAGNKQWVVDGNKNVYVYDQDGKLLGFWAAGGLTTPEDITTDGTNIWIVDAGAKKVFYYSGAASRISGSQAATSSFVLNTANTKPTGIVTDGSNLFVVDNYTTDKVFKYNLTGTTFAGSWTIDSRNSNPTGITLDPTSPSNLWIVDSGTASIYRYNAAASRTTGSQTADAVFQLASGNTNAQGIADPPPGFSSTVPSFVTASQTLPSLPLDRIASGKDSVLAGWSAAPLVGGDAQFGGKKSNRTVAASRAVDWIGSLVDARSSSGLLAEDRGITRHTDKFKSDYFATTDETSSGFDSFGLEDETLESVATDRALQLARN
jgi:hypothetical protein